MSDFKPIETQEAFDRAVSERIRREQESLTKRYNEELEQLKARNNELETENGALKTTAEESKNAAAEYDQKITELNAKVNGYETANLRTRIAVQNGLPLDLADRLMGDDEASLKADAQRFAGFMSKPAAPVPPLKNTESQDTSGKDGAYKNLIENLNLEGE